MGIRWFLGIVVFLAVAAAAGEEESWRKFMDEGRAAGERGDYQAARTAFEAALREAEPFGSEDPRVAATLENLARAKAHQRQYAEAEPLARRALQIRETILGPEHYQVADSLDLLGAIVGQTGDHAQAESLLRRALTIHEKALGAQHINTARSANNLAATLLESKRAAEAESLARRALAIREAVRGPDHPDSAQSLYNLARALYMLGRPAEAEPIVRRALAIWEKSLGSDHVEVANAAAGLANTLAVLGQFAEAEALARRALQIDEKAFGPTHPQTLKRRSLVNEITAAASRLGSIAAPQVAGDTAWYRLMAEGESALRRRDFRGAVASFESALREAGGSDSEDPRIAYALHGAARAKLQQLQFLEAESPARRALAIYEKHYGPDSGQVAAVLIVLASIRGSLGYYQESVPLLRKALAIHEKISGTEHPNVAYTARILAFALLQVVPRSEEAISLVRRALEILERALGPNHSETERTRKMLEGLSPASASPVIGHIQRRNVNRMSALGGLQTLPLGHSVPDQAAATTNDVASLAASASITSAVVSTPSSYPRRRAS